MIAILPLLLGWLEAIFAMGADRVVESMAGNTTRTEGTVEGPRFLVTLENMVEEKAAGTWRGRFFHAYTDLTGGDAFCPGI